MSLRPAWSTEQVAGQPGLLREIQSQTKHNKQLDRTSVETAPNSVALYSTKASISYSDGTHVTW